MLCGHRALGSLVLLLGVSGLAVGQAADPAAAADELSDSPSFAEAKQKLTRLLRKIGSSTQQQVVKAAWNGARVLVEPWGEAGQWQWPELSAIRNTSYYKFRGDSMDASSGFGIVELPESSEQGLEDLYNSLLAKKAFRRVSLDPRIRLSESRPRSTAAPSSALLKRPELALLLGDLAGSKAPEEHQEEPPLSAARVDSATPLWFSDPHQVPQWNIRKVRGDYTIALDATGSHAVVAVIDSGCNIEHPDLAPNLWVNMAELEGLPGVDDDGNGYIDDVHGYNFVAKSGDVSDDNGHGTHVAGIVAAAVNSRLSVTGLAPSAKVMCIKVLDENGDGFVSDAILGMMYSIHNKAHIQNHSWGTYGSSRSLKDATATSGRYGQLLVAAAGNEGLNVDEPGGEAHYPSGYASASKSPETANFVLSVAASNVDDRRADFSNYGIESVDVAAPGVAIKSLSNDHTALGGLAVMSGTSQATPLVSASAAVVLSILAQRASGLVFTGENGTLYPGGLKQILLDTVDVEKWLQDTVSTSGRINAFSAAQFAAFGNLSGIRVVQETPEGPPETPRIGMPVYGWVIIGALAVVAAVLLIVAAAMFFVEPERLPQLLGGCSDGGGSSPQDHQKQCATRAPVGTDTDQSPPVNRRHKKEQQLPLRSV